MDKPQTADGDYSIFLSMIGGAPEGVEDPAAVLRETGSCSRCWAIESGKVRIP